MSGADRADRASLRGPCGGAVRLTTAGTPPAVLDGGGTTRLFVVGGALTLENVVVQQFATTGGAGPMGVAASDGEANAPAAPPGGNGGPGGSAGTATDGAPGDPGQGGAILIMPGGMMRADGVVFRDNSRVAVTAVPRVSATARRLVRRVATGARG